MGEKHFFAVHTFVSDEARRKVLTPPEKKNPPEKRKTEKEWVDGLHGKYAKCMQTWIGNEEFFYCHWVAASEQDVYRQLDEFNLGDQLLNTMVHEVHEFLSAYRNSDETLRTYPEDGMYW
tara:strand:+ start:301 stop:660 length:360 start_codon:yes stop_codon:yes gene_type:complete